MQLTQTNTEDDLGPLKEVETSIYRGNLRYK